MTAASVLLSIAATAVGLFLLAGPRRAEAALYVVSAVLVSALIAVGARWSRNGRSE